MVPRLQRQHDSRRQDLTWNTLNLISGVSFTSGSTTRQVSYSWYADGTKYSSERSDGTGYVYKGNVIYEKAANGTLTLDCVLTTGGRIVANKNSSGTITDATNRWRYSGKEEQKAINSALPLIDYGARMYEPAIARWMSVDPMAEKYYPLSPYGYCAGNPIIIVDPQGDTIIVNYIGLLLNNDQKDDIVLMQDGNNTMFLGHLNGEVNINIIYSNLLRMNSAKARRMNPIDLYKYVKPGGDWDLKQNENTIWGIGNNKTTFVFNHERMASQDVGNHHFGVVTKSNMFISEKFALKQAGRNQRNGPNRSEEWIGYKEYGFVINNDYKSIFRIYSPPYGDDPRDQYWIKKGFKYHHTLVSTKN